MQHYFSSLILILFSAMLTACGGSSAPINTEINLETSTENTLSAEEALPTEDTLSTDNTESTENTSDSHNSGLPQNWADSATFIEIYVRAYKDSDGDGIGDLQGLTQQLDYLQEIGITGIWLMPITESSDNDHGYAVTDYQNIESQYGTLEDFSTFLTEAHKRGIGVIMDYVINHASSSHPYFTASNNFDPTYRDWFIWEDSNLGWQGWAGDSWHQGTHGYYYGAFWFGMPDWNLKNQEVIEFHKNNLRFWLDLGVDGFRFDAVGNLIENGADRWYGEEANHQINNTMRTLLEEEYFNKYLVCEDPGHPSDAAQSNSCGSAFAFGLNTAIFESITSGSASEIAPYFSDFTLDKMALLLSNHDAFAGSRPFNQLNGNEPQLKLAASILMTLPGKPFIYYGEEVGMSAGNGLQADASLRVPMSWNSQGGFTTGSSFRTAAANKLEYNVRDEQHDSDSILSHYKNLMQMRINHPVMTSKNYGLVTAGDILHFYRYTGTTYAHIIINMTNSSQNYTINTMQSDLSITEIFPLQSSFIQTSNSNYLDINLLPFETKVIKYSLP